MLGSLGDGDLDVVVDWCLDCAHEAGAHVDTLGTESESSGQTLTVSEAAGSDEWDAEDLSGAGEEDEVGDVRLADVAGALEAVDRHEVNAELGS